MNIMYFVKEAGYKKVIKFAFYKLWEIIFSLMIFPPMKVFWMQLMGAKIGKNTYIGNIYFMNLYRLGLRGLQIGDNCFIGDRVVFDLADKIILQNEVTLSDEVFILTHTNVGFKDHPLQKSFPAFTKPVIIEQGAFIGVRATILPGMTLGERSAIGACSLVKTQIPHQELHAGVPAKFIRKL